jgi:uncharacterized protein (UPF0248 family)
MNPSEVKLLFEKERLEKDVLNRITWDDSLKKDSFTVVHLDRVENKLLEIPFSDIAVDGDFFRHEGSLIPMHRIRAVKYNGEIVWARRRNQP